MVMIRVMTVEEILIQILIMIEKKTDLGGPDLLPDLLCAMLSHSQTYKPSLAKYHGRISGIALFD